MPMKNKVVAAVCLVNSVGVLAYWILFFYVPGSVQSSNESWYMIFERSFPVADAWMAVCTLLAGLALLRRRKSALLWGLLGASGLIYLGCMDVLFDMENGMYAHFTFDVASEMVLNVWCLGIGVWFILWFWGNRDALLATPAPA